MKSRNFILGLFTLILLTAISNYIFAGTTGKIAGRVTDARTGEGIPFANVIIEGTTLGAATNLEGYYTIINVPPGVYTLRASVVGYETKIVTNVRVNIDLTTRIDFELREKTVELGQEVVVTATRPLVQKDLTASTSVVGSDLISELPVTEVRDVLTLQAGVIVSAGGGIHVRGGRSGQLAYQIDGVTITDAYDNSTVIDVGTNAIQELQVISGAFNAEYGQAMSGVVNIVTKDGDNKFNGNIQLYSGDYFSNRKNIFMNIDHINPLSVQSVDASLSGPILKDRLFFFTNARYYYNEGYLYGKRIFLPTDVTREVSPDSFIVQASGDGAFVPMNPNKRFFYQAKLTQRVTSTFKLSYNFIYDYQNYKDYDDFQRLNPDNNLNRFRKGYSNTLSINHAISNWTFYQLNFSYYFKDYRHYLYKDIYTGDPARPTLYVDNDLIQNPPYSFSTGGTNTSRFVRNTGTYSVRLDWTSQLTQEVGIKFGGEFKQHRIYYENINLQPMVDANGNKVNPYNVVIPPITTNNYDTYLRKPQEGAAYIQTKLEMFNMIVNAGIRLDVFNPDGVVLSDPTDPNIYDPIKPDNKFFDYNGNGVQDPGEPSKTIEDRLKYWYKKASIKYQVSPRVGIAYPITDKGVIHFSYGHFLQLPSYELLYTNPDFELGVGSGNQGLFGNADLKPQKTVKGEIGLQQQIGDDISIDVTMFFEDFRDLIGTQTDEVLVFGGARSYSIFANSDFGFSKGITLRFEKRFSGGLATNLDYTYSITKGNASNPADARNAILGGAAPETFIAPLDWDQTHTLNIVVAYTKPRDFGFSIIGNLYSGQPYTPQINKNTRVTQNAFPRNSGRKPSIFNVDLRAYKDIPIASTTLTFFVKVYNVFDANNPRGVYGDTGDPFFTFGKLEAQKINPKLYYNTLDELYTNPGFFSEPRRVEFGISYNF
ncbi:MAG: TonB-dependent receptor [Ignavibacteria bacterium]|jgi:outer membrane cobalamin receptor|nr:TonB-dependent receptor [Ignavibacteria bacterium]